MEDSWEYDGTEKVPKDVIRVVVKDGVKDIPEEAFDDCNQMIFIDIPDSVEYVGWESFSDCTSLRSIRLPSSVDIIYGGTFSNCTSLISVNLYHSPLTDICDWSFDCCVSLKTIQFPSTLRSIGYKAFFGCTSLTSLTLPPSVRKVGAYAFDNCSSLVSIHLSTSVADESALKDCTSLQSIQFYSPPINGLNQDNFELLVYLIGLNPGIAKRPCTDNSVLLLHLVLMYGHGYKYTNIATIMKAAPSALSVRDPIYRLYPFMLATCSPEFDIHKELYKNYELKYFECVYMLIREAPWVMDFLIKPREKKNKSNYYTY